MFWRKDLAKNPTPVNQYLESIMLSKIENFKETLEEILNNLTNLISNLTNIDLEVIHQIILNNEITFVYFNKRYII